MSDRRAPLLRRKQPMRTKTDLAKQYGGKGRDAVNRAIRAECPGCEELLEAMELLDSTPQWDLSEPTFGRLTDIMATLNASRDAMESAVLSRPDVPPSYSAAQVAEAIGVGKTTVIQICKRHEIGRTVAGRLALTVEDVIAVRRNSQGRPGAPDGNQFAAKKDSE